MRTLVALGLLSTTLVASASTTKLYLIIDKSHHRLFVMHGRHVEKSYPCVFGRNPSDDKVCEGDSRTPEGLFHIARMYPHRLWSRFMLLDYPNAASWAKFRHNRATGRLPKGATVGSAVGIHGVPAGYDSAIDQDQNWTLGCISLKTADIKELYSLCRVGTRVRIVH